MLTVNEAIANILDNITALSSETVPLLEAIGRIAADDVSASINVPEFEVSARDGFAVISQDISDASPSRPRILRVIETVMAGSTPVHSIMPGTAIRIMTGAPVPTSADCIVEFEDTDVATRGKAPEDNSSSQIAIYRAEKSGANIRRIGEQLSRGSFLVSKGGIIGPPELGVLAASGYTRVKVVRHPIVAVIATGEELTEIGQPLTSSHIYSGSSYSIAALVLKCGGIPINLGIARDNRPSLVAKIKEGMTADLVITTGGVSMGDRDLVKDVLGSLGKVLFGQVRMSPGKACAFALLNSGQTGDQSVRIPHFALAGNPPASLVDFEILVRPAILKMAGCAVYTPEIVEAVLDGPDINSREYQRYIWSKLQNRQGCFYVNPVVSETGVLNSIASANGLAVIPEGVHKVVHGEKIRVIPLKWQ